MVAEVSRDGYAWSTPSSFYSTSLIVCPKTHGLHMIAWYVGSCDLPRVTTTVLQRQCRRSACAGLSPHADAGHRGHGKDPPGSSSSTRLASWDTRRFASLSVGDEGGPEHRRRAQAANPPLSPASSRCGAGAWPACVRPAAQGCPTASRCPGRLRRQLPPVLGCGAVEPEDVPPVTRDGQTEALPVGRAEIAPEVVEVLHLVPQPSRPPWVTSWRVQSRRSQEPSRTSYREGPGQDGARAGSLSMNFGRDHAPCVPRGPLSA
jgi:hypothetical protein